MDPLMDHLRDCAMAYAIAYGPLYGIQGQPCMVAGSMRSMMLSCTMHKGSI